MATVITKTSPEEMQSYINSIVLPVSWYVVAKRGFFTFISPEDVAAGGANGVLITRAIDESELKSSIDAIGATSTVIDVIITGAHYFIISEPGASALLGTVTLYKSPDDLAAGTSLVVEAGLDDSTGIADVGDVLTTYGANYTLIKAVPVDTLIVQKGGFYTVINIS